MEDFYLNIDLSKLFRAFMKEFNDKNGVKTKCICIPVEDNGIYTGFSDIAKIRGGKRLGIALFIRGIRKGITP